MTIPTPVAEALAAIFPGQSQYASDEALATVATLSNIARLASEGKLSAKEAAAMVEAQRQETLTVAAAARGAKTIDQQNAINAAIDVLKSVVVKAAGAVI